MCLMFDAILELIVPCSIIMFHVFIKVKACGCVALVPASLNPFYNSTFASHITAICG